MRRWLFVIHIFLLSLFAYDYPYNLQKFREVLNNTKLQAPLSRYNSKWGTRYGEFALFANQYFYLQDNKYMVFKMCHKKHRSELRQRDDWKVTTNIKKVLNADVKLFTEASKKEFTFLQIHTDPNHKADSYSKPINKPLLRIVWRREYHGLRKHIWAIIRTSAEASKKKYIKIDLGEKDRGFLKIKIIVLNSKLKIYIDKILKANIDVNYWNKEWNYFKAGVYMQDSGCAKVFFRELSM